MGRTSKRLNAGCNPRNHRAASSLAVAGIDATARFRDTEQVVNIAAAYSDTPPPIACAQTALQHRSDVKYSVTGDV
eukprot:5882299-Pleurochrysis_carterae.AAC.1